MTEYTDKGLQTDDPKIAVLAFDIDPCDNAGLANISYESDGCVGRCVFGISDEDGCLREDIEITIPWPLVKQAIEPVEGEPCFPFMYDAPNDSKPGYFPSLPDHYVHWYGISLIKANAITIGKTVGELRELLKRVEENAE